MNLETEWYYEGLCIEAARLKEEHGPRWWMRRIYPQTPLSATTEAKLRGGT